MTRAGLTKEERFILFAYEEIVKHSDSETVLDRYTIGARAGLTERGVNAAFKLFHRSNFVQGVGEREFVLTDHGIALAKSLKKNRS